MKKIVIIITLIYMTMNGYSQEVLNFGFSGDNIDFEDTSDYQYLKIDTNNIWFITKPQKPILFIDSNYLFLGEYAIITDTNIFYKPDIISSFQFRLNLMGGCNGYTLMFYHKYDFESNKDGGIIETSWDNGLTWQNILYDSIIQNNLFSSPQNLYTISDTINAFNNQPGYTGLQNSFKNVWLSFWATSEIIDDTLLLRFTIKSDSISSNHEGWMLDKFAFGGFLVGIDELSESNDKIDIYPNPAKEHITIKCKNEVIRQVSIYSILGDKEIEVYDSNIIQVSGLLPGMYFLRVNEKYLKKIIIE